MKRDMDLIRRMVLATADLPYGEQLEKLDGVEEEVFITHAIWLQEAGLIKATTRDGVGSSEARYAFIFRLTWDGCEFADSVRSDTVWEKAKTNVLKPTMSFSFEVLKEWLKTEISQGLPTIRQFGQ